MKQSLSFQIWSFVWEMYKIITILLLFNESWQIADTMQVARELIISLLVIAWNKHEWT